MGALALHQGQTLTIQKEEDGGLLSNSSPASGRRNNCQKKRELEGQRNPPLLSSPDAGDRSTFEKVTGQRQLPQV